MAWSSSLRRRGKTYSARGFRRGPRIEPLEDRRMLTASDDLPPPSDRQHPYVSISVDGGEPSIRKLRGDINHRTMGSHNEFVVPLFPESEGWHGRPWCCLYIPDRLSGSPYRIQMYENVDGLVAYELGADVTSTPLIGTLDGEYMVKPNYLIPHKYGFQIPLGMFFEGDYSDGKHYRYDFIDWPVAEQESFLVPTAPDSVATSNETWTDRVRVSWSTVVGADSYNIWRNTSNDHATATRIHTGETTTDYDDFAADPG